MVVMLYCVRGIVFGLFVKSANDSGPSSPCANMP
jgi:hypothetical protein